MSICVSDTGSNFIPAPAGSHTAICVDVFDMGLVQGAFGAALKVQISWAINEFMDNGKHYIVSGFYRQSLHEKSNLRKTLETWFGRGLTQQELDKFDLEALIGKSAFLVSALQTGQDGKDRAKILAITPLPREMKAPPMPRDYVRKKDRKETGGSLKSAPRSWKHPAVVEMPFDPGPPDLGITDSDVPF